jgi:hypothetical protein
MVYSQEEQEEVLVMVGKAKKPEEMEEENG